MKLDGSEVALQSAQMAFEQEQFERAQKVCSELLRLLEENHVCKTFSKCIVLTGVIRLTVPCSQTFCAHFDFS
ncbi:hypothetical protein AHF37_07119 [Paragonimus kellicotti]|nr:hypothetical protein AHF37_07119 [Paragonimus kellicotti]